MLQQQRLWAFLKIKGKQNCVNPILRETFGFQKNFSLMLSSDEVLFIKKKKQLFF